MGPSHYYNLLIMFSESGLLNAIKNSYPSYNTRFDFFKYVSMIKGTCTVILPTGIGNTQHTTQLESRSNSTQRFSVVFSMC